MKTTEKAKIELEKLTQAFINGKIPSAIARAVLTGGDMPSNKWSLSNRIMALVQTGESDCRGFRQWENAGRKVTKGAKAAYILRPNIIKKKDEKTDEEKEILIGFGCVPVFPITMTEGEPLPGFEPKQPPFLQDVSDRFGLSVSYSAFVNFYGMYQPGLKKITLCTHEEQTFFHELAHAAHNKILNGNLKPGQNAKQEIIAEMTGCVLAIIYGKQPNEGKSYEYVSAYAKELNKSFGEVLFSLFRDIEQVLSLIIETHETGDYKIAA